MWKVKIWLLIILSCLTVGCQFQEPSKPNTAYEVPRLTEPVNQTLREAPIREVFVDPAQFLAGNSVSHKKISSQAVAGVVNHHVLAADLLAEFFKSLKLASPNITTFVILSPDHFSRGHGISLSNLAYVTPAGTVQINRQMFQTLKNMGYYDGTSRRLFENEHGAGALMPFIAREFPGAEVVPIFLRSDVSLKQAEQLGRDLSALQSDGLMLILSSDMSHFLDWKTALARDERTLDWLENMNFERLKKASDANTDSGSSFAVLEIYLAEIDVQKKNSNYAFQLLSHKSSLDYGQDPGNVTTYITGIWY